MTHVCCPRCRLRFTPVAAVNLDLCPLCATPTQPMNAGSAVGFRLVDSDELVGQEMQAAAAVALPFHDPGLTRS